MEVGHGKRLNFSVNNADIVISEKNNVSARHGVIYLPLVRCDTFIRAQDKHCSKCAIRTLPELQHCNESDFLIADSCLLFNLCFI